MLYGKILQNCFQVIKLELKNRNVENELGILKPETIPEVMSIFRDSALGL